MIKHFPFYILGIIFPVISLATEYSVRGHLSSKANRYTNNENNTHSGQNHRAQLEQESRIGSNLTFINQARWSYSSRYSDLSAGPSLDPKDTHKIYLGDNYFKYKSSDWVLQTGYQEVAWGEAFGFNYADIVNPKDLKETFYSDYSDSRLPLFLVNYKYFFNNGSLQLIYSPESQFSETLPVGLFTKNSLPQTTITTIKAESPSFFEEHEFGGKLSKSIWGIDASIFYFNYLDREATYTLQNATLNSITLDERHDRINTTGVSLAKTLFDDFVFRTDIVYTKNKKINSISGLDLVNTTVDVTNVLVSLDTPTYNKFSGVFVYAASQLSEELVQAFRENNESYAIAKISYDLGAEKTFDLSYTHEFTQTGHAVQSLFTWPVTSSLDLKVGAEVYWGNTNSQLAKIKNVSNVFFGIKNYFQL